MRGIYTCTKQRRASSEFTVRAILGRMQDILIQIGRKIHRMVRAFTL